MRALVTFGLLVAFAAGAAFAEDTSKKDLQWWEQRKAQIWEQIRKHQATRTRAPVTSDHVFGGTATRRPFDTYPYYTGDGGVRFIELPRYRSLSYSNGVFSFSRTTPVAGGSAIRRYPSTLWPSGGTRVIPRYTPYQIRGDAVVVPGVRFYTGKDTRR